MKTQVAIIGAGPAGLLLGHLLRAEGIDCVIIERQSPDYVMGRIRAGVLETVTTDLLHRLGIDARLNAEGLVEDGFNLATDDQVIRIDIKALTGKHVTVYGQTEVTRDLIEAAPERDLEIVWEAGDVALHDVTSDAPYVTWQGRAGRLPVHRRVRRVSRSVTKGNSEWARIRASLSVRLAGYPRGCSAVPSRADLCQHA